MLPQINPTAKSGASINILFESLIALQYFLFLLSSQNKHPQGKNIMEVAPPR